MLYGYKEMLDNRVASIVAAAETVEEYTTWTDAVLGQTENRNWVESYASNLLDGLRNETFKGYKRSVLALYHDNEEQRTAFWTEWNIVEVQSQPARDRHLDMVHAHKESSKSDQQRELEANRTIESQLGLDVHDPWDRRSEEEREADKLEKAKMEEMRKAGTLSEDSFGGAEKQRESNPNANNVPGAYSRQQAVDALKTFSGDTQEDLEQLSNDDLKGKLEAAGVPNIQGVYNDGEVPQKATKTEGDVFVTGISSTRNEDGSINIDSVMAHKHGGEVDEIEKAVREAAHEDKVETAKAGRKSFSPEDFAAVLRGDGSADAVTHEEGDNRKTRQAEGNSRPSLSDHAEQARKDYAEQKAAEAVKHRDQARKEADVKARGERDRGVFKGADLVEDETSTVWDELPENLRKLLEESNLKQDSFPVKNYPFNSELGGRALLPADTLSKDGMRLLGEVNLTIEGSMTMNGPGVYVVSREDTTQDGYGIYGKARTATVQTEEGETTDTVLDIWLVRIRA